MNDTAFERRVFINCPFDEAYRKLLWPLLFCLKYLELEPRIASESFDSGTVRYQKILELIRHSRYSIHDLSRIQSTKAGEFARMNMPFELGLDLGCRNFSSEELHQTKSLLIIASKSYDYQKSISDLAGIDTKAHGDDEEKLVSQIREWVSEIGYNQPLTHHVSGTQIWGQYNKFWPYLYEKLRMRQFKQQEIDSLPIGELMGHMDTWIDANRH